MSETPKQKAIREAYGEHWEQVKDFVNENGWFEYDFYDQNKSQKYKTALDLVADKINTLPNSAHTRIIPKSLQGIDSNNGWLSVEEHGLPKEAIGEYFVCVKGKPINGSCAWILSTSSFCSRDGMFAQGSLISHYQPVVKPKPPIY